MLQHRGANVAPWNVGDYRLSEQDGAVYVDGVPLVFFHFHGFKQLNPWLFNSNLGLTFRFPSRVLRRRVFEPYIRALTKYSPGRTATGSIRTKRLRHPILQAARTSARTLIGILFRQYLVYYRNRVY